VEEVTATPAGRKRRPPGSCKGSEKKAREKA